VSEAPDARARSRAISLVVKLRALAESPEPEEAASARRRAAAIVTKYALTDAEIDRASSSRRAEQGPSAPAAPPPAPPPPIYAEVTDLIACAVAAWIEEVVERYGPRVLDSLGRHLGLVARRSGGVLPIATPIGGSARDVATIVVAYIAASRADIVGCAILVEGFDLPRRRSLGSVEIEAWPGPTRPKETDRPARSSVRAAGRRTRHVPASEAPPTGGSRTDGWTGTAGAVRAVYVVDERPWGFETSGVCVGPICFGSWAGVAPSGGLPSGLYSPLSSRGRRGF
jgi:hypothetical protein